MSASIRTKVLITVMTYPLPSRGYRKTVFPYNSWVVLGVFWLPREKEGPVATNRRCSSPMEAYHRDPNGQRMY